jgi:hypothetical protein
MSMVWLPKKLRIARALTNAFPKYNSSQNPVNIIFKYGVGAKNELNTFEGTYTKDLVIDNTVTTRLILSHEELRQIQQKLSDIGFFDYPETFPLNDERWVTPQVDYYIKVQNGSTVKEVSWNDNSKIDSTTEDSLGQLASFIIRIMEQKIEYKMLPPAKGGYC